MKTKLLLITFMLTLQFSFAQKLTQTIRGKVIDHASGMPLFAVNVFLLDSGPPMGSTTGVNGTFRIDNVPVGRQSLHLSYVGYKSITVPNIAVTSAKEVVLTIEMEESINKLDEVKVVAKEKKSEAMNKMATLSMQSFTVEQASRFAGGMDDPSRLASSYAGVAAGMGSNAIVVRGNAPKGLLWSLEGVEISNPNHFSDMVTFGGGGLTALSSLVLDKTDFLTAAFPAEYGNALSGVFDLRMRAGNNQKREHAFQIGSNGIDVASEGPFKKGKQSSYLFNYRYSTLALITPILPPEAGKISYQDFSFKLNFPTNKAGVFSVWGLGSIDRQKKDPIKNIEEWNDDHDRQENTYQTGMGAFGITNKYILGKKSYLHTTLAASGNMISLEEEKYDENLVLQPFKDIRNNTWNYVFSASVKKKFGARHTNKTGFYVNRKNYDISIYGTEVPGEQLARYADENGASNLFQGYTQSKIKITDQFTANLGLHSLYFSLNNHYTIEPRAGLTYELGGGSALSMAYGLHSRMEMLAYYLLKQDIAGGNIQPNKNLDFSKAHHFVIGYTKMLNENTQLKIEPYLQKLYDVPVIPNSYFSLQNLESDWFFNDSLVNKGKGTNMGIDLTLEQFLNKGVYYLFTTSVFDSKYTGGDGIERNSRFDREYVINLLAGKEWKTGRNKQNLFSLNGKINLLGGNRMHPVNRERSIAEQVIVYDYSHAFDKKEPGNQILSFSIHYRINKEKYSSLWSFNIINVLGQKEFEGYEFNTQKQTIEKEEDPFVIPQISYKIEF